MLLITVLVGMLQQGVRAQAVERSTPARETRMDAIQPFRRVLWVTRFSYQKPADLERIFYNAASLRMTDVMFQVRGEGTVYYKSEIEPWAWQLTWTGGPASTGKDPGWDPLALAIKEAGKYGIRVHAYLNVLPGWRHKDEDPPKRSGQLWAVHRDWFMLDLDGDRMSPRKDYAFLDPALPEVREYLAGLFAEVARKYPVDGVHLDYIRYPHQQGDFSYNPGAVEAFAKLHNGAKPTESPVEWNQFRRDAVTQTVRQIATAVREARPGIEVTASVVADQNRALFEVFQPSRDWIREGIVDAICPMAYIDKMQDFEGLIAPFAPADLREGVWPGIYAHPQKNTHLYEQIRRTLELNFPGVAVFDYELLYDKHEPNVRARKVYDGIMD